MAGGGAADDVMPVTSSTAAAGRAVVVLGEEEANDDRGLVARCAKFECAGVVSAAVGLCVRAVVEVVTRGALPWRVAVSVTAPPEVPIVAKPTSANVAFDATHAMRTRRIRRGAITGGSCSVRRSRRT